MGKGLGEAVKEGREMQIKAEEFIENFEWEELQNSYDSIGVSSLGADLQREEMARNTATSVDALRSGGIRGVMGGLGRVQAQNQFGNRQIAADLDRQQKDINMARAQDQSKIRGMTERRQEQELLGYGQMLNMGTHLKYKGKTDIMNAVQAAGQTSVEIMNAYGNNSQPSSNDMLNQTY